jgi:hypothetical protein
MTHTSGRYRLDFGPVYYRGRLDNTSRILIVEQDPATNEIIAHRVFVCSSGRRLQGLLQKLGINRSYLMVNTFLFSVVITAYLIKRVINLTVVICTIFCGTFWLT